MSTETRVEACNYHVLTVLSITTVRHYERMTGARAGLWSQRKTKTPENLCYSSCMSKFFITAYESRLRTIKISLYFVDLT